MCVQGQYYNIPVAVWLLDTHPYNAPLCYVKPTQVRLETVRCFSVQDFAHLISYGGDQSNSVVVGPSPYCILFIPMIMA
jgi:hypothetical protein